MSYQLAAILMGVSIGILLLLVSVPVLVVYAARGIERTFFELSAMACPECGAPFGDIAVNEARQCSDESRRQEIESLIAMGITPRLEPQGYRIICQNCKTETHYLHDRGKGGWCSHIGS